MSDELLEAVLLYFTVKKYLGEPEPGSIAEMGVRKALGLEPDEDWETALRACYEDNR